MFGSANNCSNSFDFDFFNGELDGFSFNRIYAEDLLDALNKVKSNSIGTDGFPIKFIKITFPYIFEPLLHLFNMIITSSSYPDGWKLARVVPIPKKDSDNNYRPISILSSISKIMEHILKCQILYYISQHNLLSDVQYAYREGYSTSAMLLGITETAREHLNNNKNCVMISLDLSKAFDRLDHGILIRKLREKFGFSVMACKLIYSYLRGRSQYVTMNGNESDVVPISFGVPQGSVIGPILFLMYLNDCVDTLDKDLVQPFIFADDIQLVFACSRDFPDVLEAVINFSLDRLHDWMLLNNFTINASKTRAIMFRTGYRGVCYPRVNIRGTDVHFVESLKCLGTVIDHYLNFSEQIDAVSRRVTSGLRRLYHCGLYLPTRVKYTLAHTLLMSHVNYCLEVDSGTLGYNMAKFENIVKRIVRFVYGISYRDHVSTAIIDFLGCSVQQYLRLRNLMFFYKIIKTGVPNYLKLKFQFLRSGRNPQIVEPLITCSIYERSFLIRTARNWNYLPLNLRTFTLSCNVFKTRLLSYLLRSA